MDGSLSPPITSFSRSRPSECDYLPIVGFILRNQHIAAESINRSIAGSSRHLLVETAFIDQPNRIASQFVDVANRAQEPILTVRDQLRDAPDSRGDNRYS